MKDDRERLLDILEAIENIERYASRGREAFEREELLQVWMIHHLQIIGEAVRGLSEALRVAHPEVPWRAIVAMRNIVVHQYSGVDTDEVWTAVDRDVPTLRQAVNAILLELEDPPPDSDAQIDQG